MRRAGPPPCPLGTCSPEGRAPAHPLVVWVSQGTDPDPCPESQCLRRAMGRTVRAERLDWTLVLGRRHLDQALSTNSVRASSGRGRGRGRRALLGALQARACSRCLARRCAGTPAGQVSGGSGRLRRLAQVRPGVDLPIPRCGPRRCNRCRNGMIGRQVRTTWPDSRRRECESGFPCPQAAPVYAFEAPSSRLPIGFHPN